jgi:hypothetical protein
LGMLSATVNARKFVQICPKLPKTPKICHNLSKDETLKYHQNQDFIVFQK